MPSISVVIPAYNEAENLPTVVAELIPILETLPGDHEILVVDDGSTDDTTEVLAKLELQFGTLRSVRLRRNRGKSTALLRGFRLCTGDVIVMMDADGQDDPHEIPRMVAVLGGDVGMVTGRRAVRRDRMVKRRTSQLYNSVTARMTGVGGRDFNSGLKAMTRELVESVDLYGELHRYLPVLAAWEGFAVTELDVQHRPRLHGRTKYGIARFWRGLFDLVTVKFLTSYNRRPLHLFGGAGLIAGVIGSGFLAWMLVLHFMGDAVGTRPALITGVLFEVVAVQLLSFGLLAELLVHLRRRDQHRSGED
jgi:glycosyltransferase involved in cell wall biosynthesis